MSWRVTGTAYSKAVSPRFNRRAPRDTKRPKIAGRGEAERHHPDFRKEVAALKRSGGTHWPPSRPLHAVSARARPRVVHARVSLGSLLASRAPASRCRNPACHGAMTRHDDRRLIVRANPLYPGPADGSRGLRYRKNRAFCTYRQGRAWSCRLCVKTIRKPGNDGQNR